MQAHALVDCSRFKLPQLPIAEAPLFMPQGGECTHSCHMLLPAAWCRSVQVVSLEPGGALRINPPAAGLPPVGAGTRLSLLYAGTHGRRVTALEAAGNQVWTGEGVG